MTPQATGTTHPDADHEVLAPDHEALAPDHEALAPDHEALAPDDVTPLIPYNDTAVTLTSDPEISEKPTPSHTRTGEDRTSFWATLPFILHFATVLTLIAILPTYIDKHHFNLEHRSTSSGFAPLQSDITTAISAGVAIYRFFATMWSGAMLWRCIFLLLGDGGISLEKMDTLLTWQIHIPPRLLSSQALVSIILLATFPVQLSGPILTGSITWLSSHRLVVGPPSECVTGIGGFPEQSQPNPALDNTLTSAFASTAWLNSLEDERTMKRVIDSVAHLPINSTLNNVTLPYFAISNLEWIRDPQTIASLNNRSVIPFTKYSTGLFALIPGDRLQVDLGPSVISETRIIVGIFGDGGPPKPPTGYATRVPFPRRAPLTGPCTSSSLFGDLPENIGFFRSQTGNHDSCLIYGRVTYAAGGANCKDCRISSRVTIQNDSALAVLPSAQTRVAIDMMAMVGGMMVLQNNSLPRAYKNLDRYVTELLIRSYAASWTHIRRSPNMTSLSTEVQIAIPTSLASIKWWRVWLWLSLNLLCTFSGLLFLVVQRLSGQKLVGSPQLAAFLLDTSQVLHERDRAFCNFSTLTKGDKGIGNLRFVRNWDEGGHKQVGLVEE